MHPRRIVSLFSAIVLCVTLFGGGRVAFAQDNSDAASAAAAPPTEMLVFEVNRLVTVKDHGFPWDNPPKPAANGNWMTPSNFAGGVLHFRVQVRSQPRPQNMRLQFCIWQYKNKLENCGSLKNVSGTAGTVVTWSQPVQNLWKKGGKIIDWKNPRDRYGFAIKNSAGKPVSDYSGWNWNGENPAHWYPLNVRINVVVVAKGKTFGGWGRYIGAGTAADAADAALPVIDEGESILAEEFINDPNYGSGLSADFAPEAQVERLLLPLVSR